MKKTFVIVLFFVALQTFGQVADDFSDGNFSVNPVWTGDNAFNWTIQNNQLRSNSATPSSSFYLITPSSTALNCQWDFFVNLQFNTSVNNYVDIYLVSEQANLNSATNNGYFVRIGGTPDEISLYKITAGATAILINGADGITNTSTSSIRVKVTRTTSGEWSLNRDASGANNFISEGNPIIDNTFTSSAYFGIRIQQSTSGFFNKHFFDDIYVGNIILDNTPPVVQSVQVVNANTLRVAFNEKVDATSAQSVLNYSASNALGNPVSALLQPDEKSVQLVFATAFANGVTAELSMSGIKDLAGNTITNEVQSFLYFVPQPAVFNDLVFNELFPDPSPQIGLPTTEFIEIYNRSSKPFDLNGWTLSDATSEAVLPAYLISPGDHLILTSTGGAADYTSYGKVIGLANFPTLNNAGDAIKLVDATSQKIDSVNYSSAWYQNEDKAQGGWTIERLNTEVSTNEDTNWQASENTIGGTPGKRNSVFGKNPDSNPPQILKVVVVNDKELQLEFNEVIEPASAQLVSNYIIDKLIGTPSAVTLLPDLKTVQILFQQAFTNGVSYQIAVKGVRDLAGNTLVEVAKPFRYFIPTPAKAKDILITEIMADPAPVVSLPEAEYIEIFNRSTNPFDLANWKLLDATTTITLPSFILLPGSFLILTSTSNASKFSAASPTLGISNFPSLNNSGEPLVLKDIMNVTIDSVNFTSKWYQDEEKADGGWSLELIDLENVCGEENNWTASEHESGGTPGKSNSVLANKPDLTGPRLTRVTPVLTNQLTFEFDEKLEKKIAVSSFHFTPDVTVKEASFTDLSLRHIDVTLGEDMKVRQLYSITVNDLRDCNGNNIQQEFNRAEIALPEAIDSLDILVNEILFNPRTGGVDFVEFFNASPKYISLKDAQLANYEERVLQEEKTIATADFLIPPRDYIVFTENASILKNQYPQSVDTKIFEMDLPGLSDDEGAIAFVDPDNKIIDYFFYSETYHSPLIKDDEGVSLERISFTPTANDNANWRSCAADAGYATPGFINSNTRPDAFIIDEEVRVIPEVFSTSTAGANFVQVQYKFEEAGQQANVKIYDQQGRVIKELTNNMTLSYDGFLRWDGDLDDGSKARSGYYVVWFEVFNLTGKVKTYRKRVVVASSP